MRHPAAAINQVRAKDPGQDAADGVELEAGDDVPSRQE